MNPQTLWEIDQRMAASYARYGTFASTHEGLGVCSEEWDEFREAIRSNDLSSIRDEALDLVSVLVRLHDELIDEEATLVSRSQK